MNRRSAMCLRLSLGLFALFAGGSANASAGDDYGIKPAPLSTSSPVAVILKDPAARAVLERRAPKLLVMPQLPTTGGLSLADIQPFASTILTVPVMAAIEDDLAKLPVSPSSVAAAHAAIAEVRGARLDGREPWITHPAAFASDYLRRPIALQFRRTVRIASVPKSLQVEISADNRYVLYVNGKRASAGPARGDLEHYRFEIVDVAPFLSRGTNVIAADVWNDGKVAPVAEISAGHTGFMLRARKPSDRQLDSGPLWQVRVNRARNVMSGPKQIIEQVGPTYYAAGPPEQHSSSRHGWQSVDTAMDWIAAVPAVTQGEKQRRLVANVLPPMRYAQVSAGRPVRSSPTIRVGNFPTGPATIAPNSEGSLLIDLGQVRAFYPTLTVSGGNGSEISVRYAEALYESKGTDKEGPTVRFRDRARVADGKVLGLIDTFAPNGSADNHFAPFWWRAGRFIEIGVKTASQPLTLQSLNIAETGYPFEQRGLFDSSDPELNAIWQIGWQTALFDAHETYMDTAYWEQLQYVGDTRIQALLSYDVAGDPRLARQAIAAFDNSRVVDGLPQSSWPISSANPIPPFALLWIGMIHDYWMRQPDAGIVREHLQGIRAVVDWYGRYTRPDGMVRGHPGWLFVDWRDGLDGGRDREGKEPDSCVISLMRIGALQEAADLEQAMGSPDRAVQNRAAAVLAANSVRSSCWDERRQLFANTPERLRFSQHTNILAVLYDVAPAASRRSLLERVTLPDGGTSAPDNITPVSYYFAHYLAKAFDHAGMTDRYIGMLKTWRSLLGQNFTTFPENPDPTRSDSHAWSAHPTSGLLTYVAGIQSAAPGFSRVRIAPHLGSLRRLHARMAHPGGVIDVRYSVSAGKLKATILLPAQLAGSFRLNDREWQLEPGRNQITAMASASPGDR